MYKNEKQMYRDVIPWFEEILTSAHPRAKIDVVDTSKVSLWRFLKENNYYRLFPDYITYEIRVDITGIVITKTKSYLSFVECKLKPITLRDISQLLGYSKVAMPEQAIIISPQGISRQMSYLLRKFNRIDVLDYGQGRRIKIGIWNPERKEVNPNSWIPAGEHLF